MKMGLTNLTERFFNSKNITNIFAFSGFFVVFMAILGAIFNEFFEKHIPSILKDSYPAVFLAFLLIIASVLSNISQKLNKIELQDLIRTKLNLIFTSLKVNEEAIIKNKYLFSIQNEILTDTGLRIKDIGKLSDGKGMIKINDEYLRVQYIRYLFAIEHLREIFAVTYDIHNYFMNFWGGLNFENFVEVNKKAAANGAVIQRIFVFKKSEFDSNREKQKLYSSIQNKLSGIENVQTYRIWEEDIMKADDGDKIPKISFLLIDNYIASEVKNGNSFGHLTFGDAETNNDLKERFDSLMEIKQNYVS